MYISTDEEPSILIDDPSNTLAQVFQNNKVEYIPLSDYAHAIVDAYAINKNLPINVNATNLFRNIFKVYSINSVVRGNCLIYGSLNQKGEIDYANHSVPYDYIISSTKIQHINYYGYE